MPTDRLLILHRYKPNEWDWLDPEPTMCRVPCSTVLHAHDQ